MCLGLATTLGASSNQSGYVFTLVFMLVWVGSLVVTANARLLGYRMYNRSHFVYFNYVYQIVFPKCVPARVWTVSSGGRLCPKHGPAPFLDPQISPFHNRLCLGLFRYTLCQYITFNVISNGVDIE